LGHIGVSFVDQAHPEQSFTLFVQNAGSDLGADLDAYYSPAFEEIREIKRIQAPAGLWATVVYNESRIGRLARNDLIVYLSAGVDALNEEDFERVAGSLDFEDSLAD
jgi:hypothetical protein